VPSVEKVAPTSVNGGRVGNNATQKNYAPPHQQQQQQQTQHSNSASKPPLVNYAGVATRKNVEQQNNQQSQKQRTHNHNSNRPTSPTAPSGNKSNINTSPPRPTMEASPAPSPSIKSPSKVNLGILNQRGSSKASPAQTPTPIVEPVEKAFSKFVVNERTVRKNEKDKEASNLIENLKSFSQNLKLKSPVPPDLQEMFASSKRKPAPVDTKTAEGTGPVSPSPSNASSSAFKFNAKASTFTPNPKSMAFVPVSPQTLTPRQYHEPSHHLNQSNATHSLGSNKSINHRYQSQRNTVLVCMQAGLNKLIQQGSRLLGRCPSHLHSICRCMSNSRRCMMEGITRRIMGISSSMGMRHSKGYVISYLNS
jgi:hypothetical protein